MPRKRTKFPEGDGDGSWSSTVLDLGLSRPICFDCSNDQLAGLHSHQAVVVACERASQRERSAIDSAQVESIRNVP